MEFRKMVMITTSWEIDGETVETVPEFIYRQAMEKQT